MNKFFAGNCFYPQNFFAFKKADTDITALLDMISSEASKLSPESFDATVNYFTFVFRYHPPYVSVREFPEMRRLQEIAMSHTRFKDEYNGYIAIDVSEWAGHTDEEHFTNCLRFLCDMAPHWKYVFFADAACGKQMLSAIEKSIWLSVISKNETPMHTFADKLSAEFEKLSDKKLAAGEKSLINTVFGYSQQSEDTVKNLAYDMSLYFDKVQKISDRALEEYFSDNRTYAYAIMDDAEKAALHTYILEKEKKI